MMARISTSSLAAVWDDLPCSCEWLGKQLASEKQALAEAEVELDDERSKPQPDESRLVVLARDVAQRRASCDALVERMAECEDMCYETGPE